MKTEEPEGVQGEKRWKSRRGGKCDRGGYSGSRQHSRSRKGQIRCCCYPVAAGLAGDARRIHAAVRSVTDLPLHTVVFTHGHVDHAFGLRAFLEARGWWSAEREAAAQADARREVLLALQTAERKERPPVSSLFEDVYGDAELPASLARQKLQLEEHMLEHRAHYGSVSAPAKH